MQGDKHIQINHEDNPEEYAAYWSGRHVAELANPHATFYNPLRKPRRWVDLETVQVGLVCLAVLIALVNLVGMVLS